MSWIILLSVVIVMIVTFAVLKAKGERSGSEEMWPFYARKPLSQPEQVLYFRLARALPDHIVLAQVQLSRLIGVRKGSNSLAWSNRINRLSADFVVCEKDWSIVAVIELDDASHQREDRRGEDAKKEKALSSANIRVIRWQAKALPDESTIQAASSFNSALGRVLPQAARPLS